MIEIGALAGGYVFVIRKNILGFAQKIIKLNLKSKFAHGVLGFWGFGVLGIWGFGDLGIWGFGDLGIWGFGDLRI